MIELENTIPYFTEGDLFKEPPRLVEALNIFFSVLAKKGLSCRFDFCPNHYKNLPTDRSLRLTWGYDEEGFLREAKQISLEYVLSSNYLIIDSWNKEEQSYERKATFNIGGKIGSITILRKLLKVAEIKISQDDLEDLISIMPKEALLTYAKS